MLVLWQGQIGEMKKCSTKRTYLNVPIQVQLSGNSEEKELNIDCELVENNLTNKTLLMMSGKQVLIHLQQEKSIVHLSSSLPHPITTVTY